MSESSPVKLWATGMEGIEPLPEDGAEVFSVGRVPQRRRRVSFIRSLFGRHVIEGHQLARRQ